MARAVVLVGVKRLMEMGLWSNGSRSSRRYLPSVLQDYGLDHGFTAQELGGAMRSLIKDGKLFSLEIGTYQNGTPRFGLSSREAQKARRLRNPAENMRRLLNRIEDQLRNPDQLSTRALVRYLNLSEEIVP
jgi:hypothetical protein